MGSSAPATDTQSLSHTQCHGTTFGKAAEVGGVETVALQLDMSLRRAEPASISLDDWGIEWGPYYAMKPVLLDMLNAVKAHEYDNEPWGEVGPDTTHRRRNGLPSSSG